MKNLQSIHTGYARLLTAVLGDLDRQNSQWAKAFEESFIRISSTPYLKGLLQRERRDLQGLEETFWPAMGSLGFTHEMERLGEDRLEVRCSACPWASALAKEGKEVQQWGYRLFCKADYHLLDQYNPQIKLTRCHTLMEGHHSCVFRYSLSG